MDTRVMVLNFFYPLFLVICGIVAFKIIKKKKNERPTRNIKDSFYAKIPTIYLELHRFNFRHGTYQSPSQNFIGRDDIRSRLRAILTHNDSNSGTYLITGDRGVGKTSLVNKVLEELAPPKRIPKGFIRFFNLAISTFVASILINLTSDINQIKMPLGIKLIPTICFCIFSLCTFYICYFSLYREKHSKLIGYAECIFKEYLLWGKDNTWSNKLYNGIKGLGILALILGIHLYIDSSSFFLKPMCLCLWFGIILLIIASIRGINNMLYRSNKKNNKDYKHNVNFSKSLSYITSTIIFFTILSIVSAILGLFINSIVYLVITLVILIIAIFRFVFIYNKQNKENKINRLEIFYSAGKIILENMKRHYSIKHIFNTPKQLFVKINLGYEELKSIDVLRLISHNITIEYQKYLYSGSFYTLRALFIILICFFTTKFFANYVNYEFDIENGLGKKILEFLKYHEISGTLSLIYTYVCRGIDYVWNFIYYTIIIKDYWNLKFINSDYVLEYFPFRQFMFFLLLILIYKSTAYIPFLKFTRAPFINLRRLKELQDSIAATIKREEGITTKSPLTSFFSIGYRRNVEKNYPMSDAHDIEKRLIDILSDIANGWFFLRPQFIIVFDEMDKLESTEDKKEKTIKTDSFSPDTIRSRQEAVFKLLASLKYILTTMQAKFIFVAGREIYEASLADATDRSHYLSSIFNDVINVPSFMSDFSDDKSNDICSMTEQYVCRHLLPDGLLTNDFSLNTYYEYLLKKDNPQKHNTQENENFELERQKILFILHNFIVYLTYASKGAPKKMISLFEKYVKRQQPYDYNLSMKEYEEKSIVPITRKYYRNTIYFLKFDFYEQYAINIMARMVSPIIYRFNRGNIHQYGDKLMVSTLFFLDHLYKFHRHSFSWRALESSPELIDVNKTPELRDHITDLLHFLSQNDLKSIGNGLYDFRFFKKISQEISFLTRVSEQASAIFNFTLDESLAVKQYYRRRLATMREQYIADQIKVENTVDELASMHFTLGELSLYDEDIEDATVEFDSALSILYTLDPTEMTSEQIVVLIKTMLSLGIAYEKQNLNDRAMLIYSEAVRILVASRNTDITTLGLTSEEMEDRRMGVSRNWLSFRNKEPEIYFKTCIKKEPLMEVLDKLPHLHPKIHEIVSKITVYESLRLLYLPLLAKFQMLEKSQLGGIQQTDIRRLLKEFYFLANMLNKDNKNLICSTFYLKVGDILYYKNSSFFKDKKDFADIFPFEVFEDGNNKQLYEKCGKVYYCEAYECDKVYDYETYQCDNVCKKCKQISPCCRKSKPRNENKCSSCRNCGGLCDSEITSDSLYFYKHSLMVLLYGLNYNNCGCPIRILDLIKELHRNNFKGWDDVKFNLLANILTNIGDVLLSTLKTDDDDKKNLYEFLGKYKKERSNKKTLEALNECVRIINGKLSYTVLFYILASLFYKKGTSYNMASFQYLRILTVIKYNYRKDDIKSIREISEYFVNKSIQNTGNAFKDIHFENMQDAYNIFTLNRSDETTYPTTNSQNPDNITEIDTYDGIIGIHTANTEENTYYRFSIEKLSENPSIACTNSTDPTVSAEINTGKLNSKYILYDEVFESIIAYECIYFKCISDIKEIEKFYKIFGTVRYENVSNIFNRLKLLKFKSEVNYKWLQLTFKISGDSDSFYVSDMGNFVKKLQNEVKPTWHTFDPEIKDTPKVIDNKNLIARLVSDSIFNLMEIIKFTKIYGETYLLTNIFVADTHHKLMHWLQIEEILASKTTKEMLKHLIGERYKSEILEISNWTNANRFYYKAEEMHSEGRTYKNMINRTCFLNDEYSDQRFHFITARERRKVGENDFKTKLRNITNEEGEESYKISQLCFHSESITSSKLKSAESEDT